MPRVLVHEHQGAATAEHQGGDVLGVRVQLDGEAAGLRPPAHQSRWRPVSGAAIQDDASLVRHAGTPGGRAENGNVGALGAGVK